MTKTLTFFHPDNEGDCETRVSTLFEAFSSADNAEGARVLSHDVRRDRDVLVVEGDFSEEQDSVIQQ